MGCVTLSLSRQNVETVTRFAVWAKNYEVPQKSRQEQKNCPQADFSFQVILQL